MNAQEFIRTVQALVGDDKSLLVVVDTVRTILQRSNEYIFIPALAPQA